MMPSTSWNLDDCKKFASECIDELLLPKQKINEPMYPQLFKKFKNFSSINAGMLIGTALGFYMIKCQQVGLTIDYGVVLRETLEDRFNEIEEWYLTKVGN